MNFLSCIFGSHPSEKYGKPNERTQKFIVG